MSTLSQSLVTNAAPASEKAEGSELVVFVSTTAYHKVRMYQDAAVLANKRIHFLSIDLLYRAMAGTDEATGSTEGNAKEKADLLNKVFNGLGDKEGVVASKIQEIISNLGLKQKNTKILLATDDASVSLEEGVWKEINKTGASNVLKNYKGETGPGAEFGPFASAIGGSAQVVKRVRATNSGKAFKFTDEVTFIFQEIKLKKSGKIKLVGEQQRVTKQNTVEVVAAEEAENKRAHHAVSEALHDHAKRGITKDQIHIGPRRAIVNKLAKELNVSAGLPAKINRSGIPDKIRVAMIADGYKGKLLNERVQNISPNITTSAMQSGGSEVDKLIADHDAFVFVNNTKLSSKERLELLYVLNSIVVAKQTDGRDSQKPIILLEIGENGELTDAAKVHKMMARHGFIKEGEYIREIEIDGCKVYANNYFVLVQAKNEKSGNRALNEILPSEMENYKAAKFDEIIDEKTEGNDKKIAKNTVAILCSASNQNDHLIEVSRDISKFIASLGFNVSWGAMDKYMGEAIIEGFVEGREKSSEQKLIGTSTQILKHRETANGEFDKRTDVQITTPNLSRRTERIFKPLEKEVDIVTVLPGGSGTLVEIAKHLLLNRDKQPSDKTPMIIYNPPFPEEDKRYCDALLKRLAPVIFEGKNPEEKIASLNIKNNAGAEKYREKTGVYVVNSLDEYKRVFLDLCKERNLSVDQPALAVAVG